LRLLFFVRDRCTTMMDRFTSTPATCSKRPYRNRPGKKSRDRSPLCRAGAVPIGIYRFPVRIRPPHGQFPKTCILLQRAAAHPDSLDMPLGDGLAVTNFGHYGCRKPT
jgi:hypothetical protein